MTKTPVDYSTWYSKQDAADKIGVSTKTIEQFAKDRKIQGALWRRPSGGPKVAIYAPADVDRLAAERRAESERPFVMPAGANGKNGPLARIRPTASLASKSPTIDGAAILQAMLTFQKASQNSEKLFLTIPEAAEFSGLSQAFIRRGCKDKTIAAIHDRGWKIKRSALKDL